MATHFPLPYKYSIPQEVDTLTSLLGYSGALTYYQLTSGEKAQKYPLYLMEVAGAIRKVTLGDKFENAQLRKDVRTYIEALDIPINVTSQRDYPAIFMRTIAPLAFRWLDTEQTITGALNDMTVSFGPFEYSHGFNAQSRFGLTISTFLALGSDTNNWKETRSTVNTVEEMISLRGISSNDISELRTRWLEFYQPKNIEGRIKPEDFPPELPPNARR